MDRVFCLFGPLTLLTARKIKILKKWKTPGGIIILHLCTTSDNHMMHVPWDMECKRQFFAILDHFLPFYPPKNLNKNAQRYYHSTSVYHKWKSYNEWFLRYGTEFFLILDHLLAFFKILKKWKKVWKYHHYT